MQGRPPKPTETKRREGNPGKRKLADNVLIGGRGAPLPRRGMTPRMRKVWDEVVGLIDVAVLDRADAIMLEALCMSVIAMRDGERQLMKVPSKGGGFLITTPSGRVARHPAFDLYDTATKNVRQLSEHFGMSPVARARLGNAGGSYMPPTQDSGVPMSGRKLKAIEGGRES